jgi:hypothetical protein
MFGEDHQILDSTSSSQAQLWIAVRLHVSVDDCWSQRIGDLSLLLISNDGSARNLR